MTNRATLETLTLLNTTFKNYKDFTVTKSFVAALDGIANGDIVLTLAEKYKLIHNILDLIDLTCKTGIGSRANGPMSEQYIRKFSDIVLFSSYAIDVIDVKTTVSAISDMFHTKILLSDMLDMVNKYDMHSDIMYHSIEIFFKNYSKLKVINSTIKNNVSVVTGEDVMINSKTLPYVANKHNINLIEKFLKDSDKWWFFKPFTGNFNLYFNKTNITTALNNGTVYMYDNDINTIFKYISNNTELSINKDKFIEEVISHLTVLISDKKDDVSTVITRQINTMLTSRYKNEIISKHKEFEYFFDVIQLINQ
jgi:hypothetical protein